MCNENMKKKNSNWCIIGNMESYSSIGFAVWIAIISYFLEIKKKMENTQIVFPSLIIMKNEMKVKILISIRIFPEEIANRILKTNSGANNSTTPNGWINDKTNDQEH